jgi:hypothetical protein
LVKVEAPAVGLSVTSAVGRVVVVEFVLPLIGDQPENAEVQVGHGRPPRGFGTGIETATASGNS